MHSKIVICITVKIHMCGIFEGIHFHEVGAGKVVARAKSNNNSLMSSWSWPAASKNQLYLIRLASTVLRSWKMLYGKARNHVQLYSMSPRRLGVLTGPGHHIKVRMLKADV